MNLLLRLFSGFARPSTDAALRQQLHSMTDRLQLALRGQRDAQGQALRLFDLNRSLEARARAAESAAASACNRVAELEEQNRQLAETQEQDRKRLVQLARVARAVEIEIDSAGEGPKALVTCKAAGLLLREHVDALRPLLRAAEADASAEEARS